MIFTADNLASRLLPYPVKELEVKPFTPRQLGLLSKSVMLDSYEPAIEAMSQCVPGISIETMTTGDFFQILAWQRFNSMKKSPVHANWICTGSVFKRADTNEMLSLKQIAHLTDNWNEASEEARQSMVDPDSIMLDAYGQCEHNNYVEIGMSDFRIVYLEETELDPRLDYPRVGTLADFIALQSDPEVGMLADAAQWIKSNKPLAERINDLAESEDMDLFETACIAAREIQHGILRTFTRPCSKCGHMHSLTMSIDPRSFFL